MRGQWQALRACISLTQLIILSHRVTFSSDGSQYLCWHQRLWNGQRRQPSSLSKSSNTSELASTENASRQCGSSVNLSCDASPRVDGQEDPGRGPGFCQKETPHRDLCKAKYRCVVWQRSTHHQSKMGRHMHQISSGKPHHLQAEASANISHKVLNLRQHCGTPPRHGRV